MVGSQAVLAVTLAGAFLFGMVIVLLSCLKPQLAARLGVDEDRVAGLWAAMNLILVPMTLLGGILVDTWDVRGVILAGSMVTTLALCSLLSATSFRAALLAFLATGVGGGFLSAATLVLMPRAFFGTHEASASLNMGNVFFALGALVTPALADVLLRAAGFRRTLGFLALACLTPAVLVALLVGKQDLTPASGGQPVDLSLALLFNWKLWLAGLVFFLYAPLEGCLHTWGTTYLKNVGHDEDRAARLVSAFWCFFLGGRLTAAYLQHWRILPPSWDPWVVVGLALFATVMLGNLAGTVRRGAATFGILALGFFLGPIFPTLLGVVFHDNPNDPGTAFGVMFAIGSAGSLFMAPLIGARFHRRNAQTALRIPLALGLLLVMVSLFFGLSLE
jgi:fucose permease